MRPALDSLLSHYDRLLADVGDAAHAGKLRCKQVYLQPTLVAPGYDGEFLYVGRSANAWEDPYDPKTWVSPPGRAEALRTVEQQAEGEKARLDWIEDHIAGNRFWLTAQAVAHSPHLPPFAGRWYERLAFTNLYKVTDEDASRGTPRDSLQNAQWEAAQSLFAAELALLAPRACVMNVGYSGYGRYFPGGDPASWRETLITPGTNKGLISAVGRYGDAGTLMIITERTDAQVAGRTVDAAATALKDVLVRFL